MRQLMRLLSYMRPYLAPFSASVLLMAVVGALDAFRVLLIEPIFEKVLNPSAPAGKLQLFQFPGSHHVIYLEQFIPRYFHNPLTVVAIALVGSTIIKGICDYLGTYLVNYAGFGLTTDLRTSLYNKVLARSISFFSRYPTGTLISTIVNDIEKIQFALSIVLSEFLQQSFTFIFTAAVVIVKGKSLSWILLAFIPFVIISAGKIGRRVRQTTRKGQDKLADIQNILHETVTGNRIVKAFSMEKWESLRFFQASKKLFRANLRLVRAQAMSSPVLDILGAAGIALMLWLGRDQIKSHRFDESGFFVFIVALFKLYDPVRKFAIFNNSFQQALGASSEVFRFMDTEDEVREKASAKPLPRFTQSICFDDVCFSYRENGEDSREILSHINLEVKAGEVVAVVG